MKKIIKKIGNSAGIYFTREEKLVFGLLVGDIIDIEINKVTQEDDDFKQQEEIK